MHSLRVSLPFLSKYDAVLIKLGMLTQCLSIHSFTMFGYGYDLYWYKLGHIEVEETTYTDPAVG